MKALLVNYRYNPSWLLDYPELEPIIYDRTDDVQMQLDPRWDLTKYGAVIKTPNTGDVDHDKLNWLVENYDVLPDVFLWSKTNIHKFVDDKTLRQKLTEGKFAPLLKQDHKVYTDMYGEVNKYVGTQYGPIYAERNDSWFFHAGLDNAGRFRDWNDWATYFRLPIEPYIPFAPGGSYILTRENVTKHAKDVYIEMRDTLPYAMHPVEAHCAERSYFYLWQ